jgi:hypothetical protein
VEAWRYTGLKQWQKLLKPYGNVRDITDTETPPGFEEIIKETDKATDKETDKKTTTKTGKEKPTNKLNRNIDYTKTFSNKKDLYKYLGVKTARFIPVWVKVEEHIRKSKDGASFREYTIKHI